MGIVSLPFVCRGIYVLESAAEMRLNVTLHEIVSKSCGFGRDGRRQRNQYHGLMYAMYEMYVLVAVVGRSILGSRCFLVCWCEANLPSNKSRKMEADEDRDGAPIKFVWDNPCKYPATPPTFRGVIFRNQTFFSSLFFFLSDT